MKKQILLFFFVSVAAFISCKKSKDTSPTPSNQPASPANGTLKIDFEHLVDGSPLIFSHYYTSPKGDSFTVTKFNYYISNIVVTKNDNTTFSESDGYHVVKHSDPATQIINLLNVPAGSYKSISFMLGVDSARNCSGAQSGGLEPANEAADMYWNWNSGYIMLKLEGTSPKSTMANKALQYHIGGYGGVNKTQRTFNFSFGGTTANVSSSTTPFIHLSTNLNEFFKNPSMTDLSTQPYEIAPGTGAKVFADNYADMITFKSIQN